MPYVIGGRLEHGAGHRAALGARSRHVAARRSTVVQACASGDESAKHKHNWTTLRDRAALVAGLIVTLVALPAVVPAPATSGGGGGGCSWFHGFGGGGGGSLWEWLLPVAHADEDDEDDEDDSEDEYDEDEGDVDGEGSDDDDDEDDEGEADSDEVESVDDAADSDAAAKEGADAARDGEGGGDAEDEEDDDDGDEFLQPPEGVDRNAFYCVKVRAEGLPSGPNVPTADDLFAALNCQPGFWVPRKKLQEDLQELIKMGLFKSVNVKVEPLKRGSKSKKMRAVFQFRQTFYPPVKSVTIENSKCLPPDMSQRVMAAVKAHHDGKPTGLACLATIRNEVESWYSERGFIYSSIEGFQGLDTGNIRLRVVEPKIRSISIKYMDDSMAEKPGNTPVEVVRRVITMRPGQYYSMHDGRMALQQAFTLQAFENAQVIPEYVPNRQDLMDITVFLKERPMQTMDMDLEFGMAPQIPRVPIPLPVTPVPGGQLTYENRNFGRRGDNLSASLMCSNFLHPTDDLSLRAGYKRPYVFGTSQNEDLEVDVFNSRRLSTVFAASNAQDVPPVWVDRAGVKVGLVKNLTRHSKSSMQLVSQEVKTRDDTGALVTHGASTSPTGQLVDNGPPTTLSGVGIDRTIDVQFTALRDTTFTVNGALLGSRDIAEVVQGIGCGNGLFNRYMVSLTRFLKLNTPSPSSSLAPATLVLHGKHGNAIGPLASYDYHVLGGPYSCRAYSLGELGPARHYLEAAAELRLPVPVLNTQAYVYAESAQDLGKASDLVGSPREFYNKAGAGATLGTGIKLGPVRLELAKDCNKNFSTWFFFFGERF